MSAETVTIAGREFRTVDVSTLERDVFIMGRVRSSGLDALAVAPDEPAEEFAQRCLTTLLAQGRPLELIGALLLPVDVRDEDWTPEHALEIGRLLGAATSEQDKLHAKRLLLTVLIPFLESGLASLKTTARHSAPGPGPTSAASLEPAANVSGSGAR